LQDFEMFRLGRAENARFEAANEVSEHKESDLPNVQTYKYLGSNNPLKVSTNLLTCEAWLVK